MWQLKQVEIIENVPLLVRLKVLRPPAFVLVCLWVILMLALFLPVTGFIFSMVLGNGPHIAFLLVFVVTYAMAIYLWRVILWNTHGAENLVFKNGEFSYQADYKYFKGPKKEISGEYEVFQYQPTEKENLACVGIRNQDEEILSVIKLPRTDVKNLLSLLTIK